MSQSQMVDRISLGTEENNVIKAASRFGGPLID